MPKIYRFPRYPEGYNPELGLDKPLSKRMRMRLAREQSGKLKRGYDVLKKWQKKMIRLVINGMSVRDAAKKCGTSRNVFYAYMREHPKFKQYYIAYARKAATEVEAHLDGKLHRAVGIIGEALDNPDIYLATDTATKLLTGRGYYRKNIESTNKIQGQIQHNMTIVNKGKPLDKALVQAFVDVMTGKAVGGRKIKRPDIIDVKAVELLPETTSDGKPS